MDGEGSVNPRVRGAGHEAFDLLREAAVVRSGVEAAGLHTGNRSRDETRLGRDADLRDRTEPLEVSGLQDRFAARPRVAERGIVHDDGGGAERAFDRRLELRISASTITRSPSHTAEATAGSGSGGGGGGPGGGGWAAGSVGSGG